MQARRAPRVATIHDVAKTSSRVLLRPNAFFHVYASVDTPWVSQTLSHYTSMKWGKVSSNSSTHEATHFGDSICPICVSTFQMLVQHGSTDAGLNQHRWGLPPWSSKYQVRPLPFLPIQCSPFPLIAPLGLQLCQPFDHFAKSHSTSIN
jgi:hypothetical protein